MKKIISFSALLATLSLTSFNTMAAVAFGTAIQINSQETKNVENLQIGDEIQTASEGSTMENIVAKQVTIAIHASDLNNPPVTTYLLKFGDNQQLITTADQTFLTTNGSLIRASQLVIGKHQLLDASGKAVNLNSIIMGSYQGGLTIIAPDSKQVTENLFLANGVFLGSHKISMQQDSDIEAFKGQVLDH